MSKVIDERVVSMQFDNKHFESNVKTTMSTLEKLKQSLNLSGASKGLENVSAAASKCTLSPLSTAVENVKVKFSAMEVMAITALTNITNSAVNAGKQLVKSLTITPITTGFNEYELKMGAIQTIMASTGESLATVNEYLNELNEYSDKTIYSFQDMTQNIGKFTNAGVKLEDAVLAIKGIANEAAVSGANANEASRAMYNFAQALSTGYVQRIDWKSIELANMATVEFKEQLLDSAVAMGTVEKNAEGMWKAVGDKTWYNTSQMFIESLDEQWLTSEVLIDTLKDYADETTEIGKKASAAATEVKTFTMLMDTLKESAQSGWATTWETIVGDFEESKNLFTKLSDVIGGWLGKSADRRNNLLSEVLDSNWEKAIKGLNEAGVSTEAFEESIYGVIENSSEAQKVLNKQGKSVGDLVEEYGSLREVFESGFFSSDILVEAVDDVIGGFEELELTIDRVLNRGANGDDVTQLQSVLKELGYDLGEFGDNLDGIDGKFGPVTQAAVKAFQEAAGITVDGIVGPETLEALEKAANELGTANEEAEGLVGNIKDLVKNVDNLGGRKKLIESFAKLWEKLSPIIDAVKEGFNDVFGGTDVAGTITNIIDKFSKWVDEIEISESVLSDVSSTISGIFSAIQTGAILGGGVFGVLNKIVQTAIRFVGLDLISVLGDIGDALVGFRKFLVNDNALADFFEFVGNKLVAVLEVVYGVVGSVADTIKSWVAGFFQLEEVVDIFSRLGVSLQETGSTLLNWFKGFGGIFDNFINTIKSLDSITFDGVWQAVKTLFGDMVDQFSLLGGIFQPFIGYAKELFDAFLNYTGLTDVFNNLAGSIQDAYQAYKDWCDGLAGTEDLPARIGEAIGNGIYTVLSGIGKAIANIIEYIVSAITGIPMKASGEAIDGATQIGLDIIQGLVNGLKNGLKFVVEVIINIGKTLIEKFKDSIKSHSPSLEFMQIGEDIVAGLINGLLNFASKLWGVVKTLAESVINIFKDMDFSKLSAVFWTVSAFIPSAGILNIIAALANFASTAGNTVVNGISDAFKSDKSSEAKTFGTDIASGLAGGVMDGIGIVVEAISALASKLIEIFKSILGIESPSKVFLALGGFIIAGLLAGLSNGTTSIGDAIKNIGETIKNTFSDFDYKHLFAAGVAAGLVFVVKKIVDVFEKLAEPMTSINDILKNFKGIAGGVKDTLKSLAGAIKDWGKSLKIKAITGGIKDVAVAIALLVGAVWLLTTVEDPTKIYTAVNAIIALAMVLVMVSAAIEKAGASGLDTAGFASIVLAFGIVVMLIGSVIKKLGKLTPEQFDQGVDAIAGITIVIIGLMWATNLLAKSTSKGKNGISGVDGNLKQIGGVLIKMALAMVVMAAAVKMLGGMTSDEIKQGGIAIASLAVIIVGLMAATQLIAKSCTAKGTKGVDKNIEVIGGVLFKIGTALLVMALAVKLLGSMTEDEIKQGGVALGQMAVVIVGLMAATRLLTKSCTAKGTKGVDKNIENVGGMIFKIAAAMLVMAVALRIMGTMKRDELIQGGVAMVVLAGIIVGLMAATQLIAKTCTTKGTKGIDKNITQIGKTIFAIGGAIALMAVAAKILGSMDWDELLKAAAGIVVLSGIIVGLIAATKLAGGGENLKGVGSTLLMVGVTLLLMSACMLILSVMSWDAIGKGIVGLTAMSLLIAIMIDAAKDAKDVKGTLIGIAVVIAVMSACLILLSLIDTKKLLGASAALALVIGVFALLVKATKSINTEKDAFVKTLVTIGVLTLVLIAITTCLNILAKCDPKNVLGAAVGLSILLTAMSANLLILNKFSKTKPGKMLATLAVVTLVVGALAGILYLLRNLDPNQALGTAIALGVFLTAISANLLILNKFSKTKPEKMLVTLGVVTLVVGALGLILYLLRGLNPAQAIGTAAALSLFLYALVGAVAIVGKIKTVSTTALAGLAVMTLVVGALGLILYLLRDLDPAQAIGTAGALSILLLSLSAACVILSKTTTIMPMALGAAAVMTLVVGALAVILYLLRDLDPMQAIGVAAALSVLLLSLSAACVILVAAGAVTSKALGAAAVMTLVVGALAVILYLLRDLDPTQAIGTAAALSILLLSLSAACGILALVGLAGPAAFVGIGALMTLIVALGTLIVAIGALVEKFPQLETFLDTGIPILEKIGYALGSFFGNILGGFLGGITAGLPQMGADLGAFMLNAMPFIVGAKMIDSTALEGVKTIAQMILILTAANILDGIASWFTGESSLTKFGAELAAFGPHLKTFADSVSGIDTAAVSAAAEAAKTLCEMANTVPNEGGVVSWFAGENSLAAFGPQIASFGGYLKSFADSVAGVDPATITAAANAGKALAGMANTIPNEGGLAAWFAGENSLAAFSANLPGFGTNLASFVTNLGTFTDAQVATITCASDAIKTLAKATSTIPNEGGLVAWFAGENSLATFSANLPGLGTNLASFVTNLGTFDEAQLTTINCAANALKTIAEASNTIPNEGGLAGWFAGENSIATFSDQFPGLGTNLASFVTNLGTFSDEQVSTVYSAVSAMKAFGTLADSDLKNAKDHLSGFGDKIADFGSDLAEFCSELGESSYVTTAVDRLNEILDAIENITKDKINVVKDLGDALVDFAKNGVDKFVSALTSETAKTDVEDAASKLAGKMIDGFELKESDVKDAAKTLATNAAESIETWAIKEDWKDAGKYCVKGFAAGIEAQTWQAEAKAKAMAKAALTAAEEALDENSPSKEFYRVGAYAGEGFVNALGDYASTSYNAGAEMGNSAKSGLSGAISKIAGMIESDIDAQPTIRPVMDLSDIKSGISMLNGMLNTNATIGVTANAINISSMMNNRNQNGSNNDIITAIDRLSGQLSSLGGDTYNVNGITYDDGSSTSTAVKSLVRAIGMERRMN